VSKERDKIATRLALILTKFNSGERFTIAELAQEFGVTARTIQRDLYHRLSYLPIQKVDEHFTLESYALGQLSFKDINNFAVLSGIKGLYPKLSQDFIVDLFNANINKTFLIKNQGFEDISHRYDWFEAISTAIVKLQKITFVYHDKPRAVHPYRLINNNGVWYLLADEEGKLKNFTLSKISELHIDEKSTFTPHAPFLDKIAQNDTNWFSDVAIEVVLDIDVNVRDYFLRKEIFPNKKILENTPTSFMLSTTVAYDEEILGVVKYWLPHVRILSPQPLREKLSHLLRTYLAATPPDAEG